MPIDTSIYGLIRQPQPVALESPDQIAERRMRLEALIGAREMQGLQLQQARQEMADDAAWRDTLQRVDPTKPETFGDLLRANPKRALELRKGLTDIQGTESQTRERNVKADAEMAKMGRDMIAQANPQNYGAILEWGVKNNQKWALGAPPQFDPRWQAQMVMSADEWLKRNAPTIAEAETKRANLEREANVQRGQNMTAATARRGQDQPVWDAERGVFVTRPGVGAPGTAPQTIAPTALPPKSGDVTSLRKEFNALPEVQNYRAVVPMIRSIQNAPDTPAGDLDLIYAVGKSLDPNSVVREGELALVIKAGSPIERFKGQVRVIAGGGRLTPTQRSELTAMLQNRVGELKTAYDAAQSTYSRAADAQRLPKEQIFLDLPEPGAPAPADPRKTVPTRFDSLPDPKQYTGKRMRGDDGVIYKSNGASWVRQ